MWFTGLLGRVNKTLLLFWPPKYNITPCLSGWAFIPPLVVNDYKEKRSFTTPQEHKMKGKDDNPFKLLIIVK